MTRDDADQVAKRIVNIWRTGIPHSEWSNYLVGLDDPEVAHRAIDRHLEREPRSFREFGQMYRTLAAAASEAHANDPETHANEQRLSRAEVQAILRDNGAPGRLATALNQPRRKATP